MVDALVMPYVLVMRVNGRSRSHRWDTLGFRTACGVRVADVSRQDYPERFNLAVGWRHVTSSERPPKRCRHCFDGRAT